MTQYAYILCPLLAWLVAGSLKFAVNSIRAGQWAFEQIGYGGLPSTHAAIVTSTTTLIALKEGFASPSFGISFTLMGVIIIDAIGLRRQIGKHAKAINRMVVSHSSHIPLRERMGHKKHEILAGIVVGVVVGYLSSNL